MREEEAAKDEEGLRGDPLFEDLRRAGAVVRNAFPAAYFRARLMAGRDLAPAGEGLGDLLDGRSDVVKLIEKVGRERFEKFFVKGDEYKDGERAQACGLTAAETARLMEFMNALYVRSEFQSPRPAAPVKVFSAVAGIAVHGGVPRLEFFNRETWRSAFRVDNDRLNVYLGSLEAARRNKVASFARRVGLMDFRRTTLHRLLETLVRIQAHFLISGEPDARQPVTQKSLATALGVDPSALNRLISNKCVELPWGTEVPMKALMPSGKAVGLAKFEVLAREKPELSDEGLRAELARRHRIHLSRRSVAQYRKDLGLGSKGRRGAEAGD